jgi:hypothetical protein
LANSPVLDHSTLIDHLRILLPISSRLVRVSQSPIGDGQTITGLGVVRVLAQGCQVTVPGSLEGLQIQISLPQLKIGFRRVRRFLQEVFEHRGRLVHPPQAVQRLAQVQTGHGRIRVQSGRFAQHLDRPFVFAAREGVDAQPFVDGRQIRKSRQTSLPGLDGLVVKAIAGQQDSADVQRLGAVGIILQQTISDLQRLTPLGRIGRDP